MNFSSFFPILLLWVSGLMDLLAEGYSQHKPALHIPA